MLHPCLRRWRWYRLCCIFCITLFMWVFRFNVLSIQRPKYLHFGTYSKNFPSMVYLWFILLARLVLLSFITEHLFGLMLIFQYFDQSVNLKSSFCKILYLMFPIELVWSKNVSFAMTLS